MTWRAARMWSSTIFAPASWTGWVSDMKSCGRSTPRIIYAEGSGFGVAGPYVKKGGQDVLAQAMTGVMERRASEKLPRSIYPTALCDYAAGMHLVQGILVALLGREKTGLGQTVSVNLYDSTLAMQMQEAAFTMATGTELNWAAMPLSGVFETTDGAIVLVGAFKANPLQDICQALEIEDLSETYPDLRSATGACGYPTPSVQCRVRVQYVALLARPAGRAGSALRAGLFPV